MPKSVRLGSILASAMALGLFLPILVIAGASLSSGLYPEFPPRNISFSHYHTFISSPAWRLATQNSIFLAFGSATIAVVTALPASVALSVAPRRSAGVLAGCLFLPVVFPAIVAAVSLYRFTAFFALDGRLVLLVAHAGLSVPIVVATTLPAARRISDAIYLQAASLGAGPLAVFSTVTIPLLRPAIIGSWLISFAASLDELVFALFLTDAATETLPVKMWRSIRFDIDPTVTVVGTLLAISSIVLFMGGYVITRNR